MGVGSQQDLRDIHDRLIKIETTLEREKYQPLIVGVVVAIITGLVTGVGAYITNQKQEQLKKEVTRSVEKLGEMGRQVALKQMNFYNSTNSLLNDIDDSFNAVCYLSPSRQDERKLTESLDAYRKLHEQTTKEIADEELLTAMKKYSDFVIQKLGLLKQRGKKIADNEKDQYYAKSRELYDSVKEKLNKVLSTAEYQR